MDMRLLNCFQKTINSNIIINIGTTGTAPKLNPSLSELSNLKVFQSLFRGPVQCIINWAPIVAPGFAHHRVSPEGC